MAYRNRVIIDTIRTVAFGTIGAAYSAIGTAATEPTRMVYAFNSSDVSIFISDDGVNDKFIIPAGGFILLDLTTNKVRDDGFMHPDHAVWYVKRVDGAPSSGGIHLTLIHA